MDCFKPKEEDLLNDDGLLKYQYPEVVSSFYKGPKGNLIKMFSLKNNYPLLKRKECNELRIEYFLPLAMDKLYACLGISPNKISDVDDGKQKSEKVIMINQEDQKRIAQLHLEAGLQQEKKNEFLKNVENQRKSLIPSLAMMNKKPPVFQQPPPAYYDSRASDPNFVDQRRRRESQFTKLPLNSPMYY